MATNVRKIDNLDVPFKEFMPGQIIQSGQFNDDMKDIEDKVNEIIGEQNTLVDEVNAHTDNFENPHQVTAHQTGTYTSQEIDEFVEDIKSGNLHDNAIENRVLGDDCVSTRNILDGSVTSSKLDSSVGSQIDISTNVSIKDRYTKEETDLLIQEKVGDGTYDKATIDEKLEQIQAGQILDKSINIHQLKDDVGRRLDISNNPDILNKYTRDEVDLLIQNNALPRDWGSILEEDNDTPVVIPTKETTLPVANHMKVNTCTVSESSILDVDIQENVDARGEFNTVGERLDSVDSQIKDIKKNNVSISVKEYGAKGDGVTDDTIAIKECWDYCTKNALTMFFPNGTYILNEQLKKTDNITSSDAEKPIYMIGESAFGVKINTTNEIKPVIDVSRSKTVYMSNIASDNTWFKCVQYGDDFRSFSRLRDIQLYNVFSLDRTHSYPSWNMFINTPSPFNYNNEEVDSFYNRYPIEIVSNSGYNPIMINNFANTNDDGSNGYPSDNSSIGIVDEVSNASGAILIDGGKRSFLQGQNRSTDSNVYKSAVRNNVVYEVNGQGHIAIGCSTVNNDTVAPDNATIKARDTYPKIILYDANRNNRKTILGASDDLSYLRCYKAGNTDYIALNLNQSNNAVQVQKGHFTTGDILVLDDTNFTKAPGIRGYCAIKIDARSTNTKWLDGIDCNVIGREITLYTSVSNFVLKQGTSSTSFRNKSKTDLTMEVGVAYRYIRLDDGWYQI